MKTIQINSPFLFTPVKGKTALFIVSIGILWLVAPKLIQQIQANAGLVDAGIWQLLLLSLICFLGICAITWWLLKIFWQRLGLPALSNMVLQFNNLILWQQLGFYWASFALVLLAAVGCLAAVL